MLVKYLIHSYENSHQQKLNIVEDGHFYCITRDDDTTVSHLLFLGSILGSLPLRQRLLWSDDGSSTSHGCLGQVLPVRHISCSMTHASLHHVQWFPLTSPICGATHGLDWTSGSFLGLGGQDISETKLIIFWPMYVVHNGVTLKIWLLVEGCFKNFITKLEICECLNENL